MAFQRFPWISQVFVGVTIQASKCSYSQPKVAAACFAKASFRQAMMTRNPASWKFGPKKTPPTVKLLWRGMAVSDDWSNMCIIYLYILIHLIQHACIVATLLECATPKICFLIGASRTFKTLCKVQKLQQPLRLCMESSGDFCRSMCVHQSGPHFISPRYRNRISCSCCATWKPTPLLAPVTTSRSTASVWGKCGICDLDKRSLVSAAVSNVGHPNS